MESAGEDQVVIRVQLLQSGSKCPVVYKTTYELGSAWKVREIDPVDCGTSFIDYE